MTTAARRQRLFVGDVQGCGAELATLVERADATYGEDYELWSVGDVINRGPESLRALETVRGLVDQERGQMVLGNHEIGLLQVAFGARAPGRLDTAHSILETPEAEDWIDWLRHRPLVVTGQLGMRAFAMVHAALPPRWRLPDAERVARRIEWRLRRSRKEAARLLSEPAHTPDRRALNFLTRARSLTPEGLGASGLPDATRPAWHAVWRAIGHDYGIVYGHWALQGLHVEPGLRGLDTGYVHHGRDPGPEGERFLTIWCPDENAADPFGVPDERFWQAPGQRRYIHGEG